MLWLSDDQIAGTEAEKQRMSPGKERQRNQPLDNEVRSILRELTRFDELAEGVSQVLEGNQIDQAILDNLLPIHSYREAERIPELQAILQHARTIATKFGWSQLSAKLLNVQGVNYAIGQDWKQAQSLAGRADTGTGH